METLIKRLRELQEADAARKWEGAPGPDLSVGNEAADKIESLSAEVKSLKADLALSAGMLARQCDLAREAESKEMEALAEVASLRVSMRKLLWLLGYGVPTHIPEFPEMVKEAETLCKEK